jgi:hypothetical protein
MANDLGTVNYLGVERQWEGHPTFWVYLARGLPGYPTELLIGDETEAQLSRPWMLSVKRKDNGLVVATGFFLTLVGAMTALKNQLETRLGISTAILNRIRNNVGDESGSIAGLVRKWRRIHPDATQA